MRTSFFVIAAAVGFSVSCGGSHSTSDLCRDVSCDHGRCVADGDHAACLCDKPYFSAGQSCEAADTAQCTPTTCAGTGKTCVADSNGLSCVCPAGTVDLDGSCVHPSACAPNPCTAPHQTVCTLKGDSASCSCDPGFAPSGSGCEVLPVFDCSRTNTGDVFEPDECPSSASTLAIAGSAAHTISPATDEDWISLPGGQGHIILVSISGSSFPIYVDIYSADGVTPLAANHSGASNPSVAYVDETGDSHYARIRALRANDTGAYDVTVTDLGIDDYTNDPAQALQITPGVAFAGEVQYANDVDVLKVSLLGSHSYAIGADGGMAPNLQVEVVGTNGTTSLGTFTGGNPLRPFAKSGGSLTLKASATDGTATGTFNVPIQDLGPDDRSDTVVDADLITATGLNQTGNFERANDVDVVRFNAIAGHVYVFTCSGQQYSSCATSLRDSAGLVLGSNTYSGGAVAAEATTSDVWSVSMTNGYYYQPTGSYVFKLEDLGTDDFGDTIANSTAISVGATKSGRLEVSTDVDVFSFTATAGHVYSVACTASQSSYCYASVLDSSGATVSGNSSGATTGFKASVNGTYYARVSSNYGALTYSLLVSDLGVDDFGDTASAATAITVGGSAASGRTEYSSDHDFFSFTATQGRIYRFVCTAAATDLCATTIRDPINVSIASSGYSSGTTKTVTFLAQTSGTFTIDVFSSYSGSSGVYSYQLFDDGLDDNGDTTATASALTVGAPAIAGKVQYPGDKDVFSFAATASRVYSITCTTSTGYLCAMSIKSPADIVLASSSGSYSGGTTVLAIEAGSTGNYVVELGNTYSNSTGSYTISVTDVGTDDFGDTPATATTVIADSPAATGNLESVGDKDVFSFSAAAKHIYRFSCTSSSYSLCSLILRNSGGATLASSYSSTNSKVEYVATVDDTFSVEVSGSATGAYTYSLSDLGPDDYPNTAAQPGAITPGTSISGSLQYGGDIDVFGFTPTVGHFYSVTCTSSTNACYLLASDPNGARVGGSSYTLQSFKATLSGTYVIQNGYSYSGYSGSYTLLLTDLGVDDHGDVPGAATAVALGTQTNGQLQIQSDVDYFSVSLTSGASYTVTTGTSGSSVSIAVFQPNQTTQVGSGGYGSYTFTAPTSGTFYIRLIGYQYSSSWSPISYVLTVQ